MMRVVAWLLVAAITALTFVPPALRPVSGLPHNVEHGAIFLLMGAAFGLAYPGRVWSLGLSAVLFAALLEALQMVAPGRHARLTDFIIDAAGACVGIAIAALIERIRRADLHKRS